MSQAARVGDITAHGTPLAPGPGSANVIIEYRPAWRAAVDTHICPIPVPIPPHGPGRVIMGSPTVLINFQQACRVGDVVLEALGGPDPIAMGAQTVFIGDQAMPGSFAAVAAQVKTLLDAAVSGVPFCEQCHAQK